MIGTSFSFDAIQIDAQQNTLTVEGKAVECEPKLFELLVFFCRNSERALSRDELIEHVWQGRVVSDAAVNRAVSQLRKLIEPNPSQPIYILTVSKIGYRFAVTPITNDNTSPSNSETTHSKPNLNMLIGVVAALCVFAIFILLKPASNKQILQLTERTILTEQLGITFNPFFDNTANTLYALHKEHNDGVSNPIKIHNDGSMSPLFANDAYYTDVIAQGENVYLARLTDLTSRQCEVVKFNTQTQVVSKLLDCGNSVISNMVLDDNNRLIYPYRENDSAPYKLMVFNTQTKRQQQLTHPDSVGNTLGHRVFALNNNELAYINYHATEPDSLVLMDLTDQSMRYNAPLLDDVISLTWHNQVLLISAKEGLYQFDTANKALSQLDYSDTFYRIFASNNVMYAEHYSVISNLYQIPEKSENATPQALTKRQAAILQFAPAPSDNRIAYVESINGKLSIKITDGDGAKPLTFDGKITYVTNLAWSLDASKLAANINDSLYIYDFASRQWQSIAHQFSAIHFVGFDANNTLHVSAEHQQAWNIWQFNAELKAPKQITFNGGYSFYFDKHVLYFTKFSEDGLFKRGISSNESVIIDDFPLLQWRSWQLANDQIIYRKNNQHIAFNINNTSVTPIANLDKYRASDCRQSHISKDFYCRLLDNQVSQLWRIKISSHAQ